MVAGRIDLQVETDKRGLAITAEDKILKLFPLYLLPDMFLVLKTAKHHLPVAFLKARAAFGGKGIGAAWATDARFVLG